MKKIQPVNNFSIPEIVSKNIINYIINNSLQPGERLPSERSMAETLRVSRTSLKKAVDILSHYGILQIRPQSGIYVNDLRSIKNLIDKTTADPISYTAGSYLEWRECRSCVEPAACKLCAERITASELEEIKACLDRMEECYLKNDMAAVILEDYNFHYACIKATHNESICNMYRSFCGDFYQWMVSDYEPFFLEISKVAMEQHHSIYKALEAHDGELAETISRDHNVMSITAWRTYNKMP
ncbi:MAG: FCD domain-containing protein [Sedimentibacter sp.]|uniref:FadR/GntR family transcriptional regulator n=1 Tax=Sedimentibacter sp. TaxID=1960295 RepID=UPI0031597FE4